MHPCWARYANFSFWRWLKVPGCGVLHSLQTSLGMAGILVSKFLVQVAICWDIFPYSTVAYWSLVSVAPWALELIIPSAQSFANKSTYCSVADFFWLPRSISGRLLHLFTTTICDWGPHNNHLPWHISFLWRPEIYYIFICLSHSTAHFLLRFFLSLPPGESHICHVFLSFLPKISFMLSLGLLASVFIHSLLVCLLDMAYILLHKFM